MVTIVEEARGVPMTGSCVVPRGDVLELLDDVREALPGEVDDAQDVLDHRDAMIADARSSAETTVADARTEADRLVTEAHASASDTVSSAQLEANRLVAEAERQLAEASSRAEAMIARARADADRAAQAGQDQHDASIARGHAEAERLVAAGRASYEGAVADGQAEQARLVSQTDVVQAAHRESARVLDAAHGDADRMRAECDTYVDSSLGALEETLTKTLREVGRGRTSLRSGGSVDYRL
nr:DivIVA domain-containing protein [Nakamurella flavida]